MKNILTHAGVMAVVFAIFGIVLGLLAYISGSWAQSQLITDAGGATDFGPIFIAIAYLQTAVIIFFLGPVLAALIGGLLGSMSSDRKLALISGGAGSLIGFYIMCVVALGLLMLSKGAEAEQAFSFTQALFPMFMAGIPTAIMGSLISALSSAMN